MVKTFYITRDSIKALSIFDVKPTERWINVHDASMFFPNVNYCPVVCGLYGLDKVLTSLNVPVGACWELEVEQTDDKIIMTIVDKNVFVETKASSYRYKDRS